MAHIISKEYYPLYFAIHLHESGKTPLDGLEIDDELLMSLKQFRKRHGDHPVAPDSPLTVDRIHSAFKHMTHCDECRLKMLEDAPTAKRLKTQSEVQADEEAAEAEFQKLQRRFFVSAAYSLIGFIVLTGLYVWDLGQRQHERVVDETVMKSTNQPEFALSPIQMMQMACVFVIAWGIADCVVIAKRIWLDFDRVQGAIPLIGRAWQARSRRKKANRHEKQKEQDRYV